MQFKRTPSNDGSSPVPLSLNQLLEQAKQTIERLASENQALKQENQELKQENQELKQEKQQLISTNSKLNSELCERNQIISEQKQLLQEQSLQLVEDGKLIDELKPMALSVPGMEARIEKEKKARMSAIKRAESAEASLDENQRITLKKQKEAEEERRKAQREAESYQKAQKLLTSGFSAVAIICTVWVIRELSQNRRVLAEMGGWFVSRWENILWILATLKSFFFIVKNGLVQHMNDRAAVLLTVCVFLLILGLLLFLAILGIKKGIGSIQTLLGCYDENGVLKAVLSVTFSLAALLICVYLPESVRMKLPVNIFTVWLILSLISTVLVNLKEIIKALKGERRYY